MAQPWLASRLAHTLCDGYAQACSGKMGPNVANRAGVGQASKEPACRVAKQGYERTDCPDIRHAGSIRSPAPALPSTGSMFQGSFAIRRQRDRMASAESASGLV